MNVFQDESGCLGFKSGSSKYFIVTLLCPQDSKLIGHVIDEFKGYLIRNGWPKTIEIKANHLHMARYDDDVPVSYKYKNNPNAPIKHILEKLARNEIEIDAIVINKARIDDNLRTLPYGVLYNYFSKNVLVERIIMYEDTTLFIDQTNKQTHKMKNFDDYIYTEALLTKGRNFNFDIQHVNSNVVRGVCAVDFISWGLFRMYEYNDHQFFDCFKQKIKNIKCYYFYP